MYVVVDVSYLCVYVYVVVGVTYLCVYVYVVGVTIV